MFTQALPLARYRFTATALQPLALPDYAGSLLRGQFGAALRDVACMTRQASCTACPLLQTCPYARVFEAPPPPKGQHALQDFSQIPNAYIIEPPAPGARVLATGEALVFHLVLIGHALEQLALIVFALQRALAQGLTRRRVPLELAQVDWLDAQSTAHPIWTLQHPTLAAHPATLCYPAKPQETESAIKNIAGQACIQGSRGIKGTQITLQINTPLRLQLQGKPLGVAQLNPRALIAALARRSALLMEFHAGQSGWGEAARRITQTSETLTDTRELAWFDWTRYSSRQQQEMTLGGVLGAWTLHGSTESLAEIEPWLWLGQWLHAGKNATMGLGGYTLAHTP
jgi:hypothetical protein